MQSSAAQAWPPYLKADTWRCLLILRWFKRQPQFSSWIALSFSAGFIHMICCSWGDNVFIAYFSTVFCCWHIGSGGCCCYWCGKMKVLARMRWSWKPPETAVGCEGVEAGWFPGGCACTVRAAVTGRNYVSCLDLFVGNLLSLLDLQATHQLSGRIIIIPECIKTNLVKTWPLVL